MAAEHPAAAGLTAVPRRWGWSRREPLFLVDPYVSEVVLLIGIAVGVDYSMFYSSGPARNVRQAAEGAALEAAAATSGRSVLISGLTVITAMAGMFFTGDTSLPRWPRHDHGGRRGDARSLTVLPALLSRLGDRVEAGQVPFLARHPRPANARPRMERGRRSRPAGPVSRCCSYRAVSVIALAIPAFSLNTASPGMTGSADRDSR